MAFNDTVAVETLLHGTGTSLNMCKSASQNSELVCRIPNGSTIYVENLSGEWLYAKYNGYTG